MIFLRVKRVLALLKKWKKFGSPLEELRWQQWNQNWTGMGGCPSPHRRRGESRYNSISFRLGRLLDCKTKKVHIIKNQWALFFLLISNNMPIQWWAILAESTSYKLNFHKKSIYITRCLERNHFIENGLLDLLCCIHVAVMKRPGPSCSKPD